MAIVTEKYHDAGSAKYERLSHQVDGRIVAACRKLSTAVAANPRILLVPHEISDQLELGAWEGPHGPEVSFVTIISANTGERYNYFISPTDSQVYALFPMPGTPGHDETERPAFAVALRADMPGYLARAGMARLLDSACSDSPDVKQEFLESFPSLGPL